MSRRSGSRRTQGATTELQCAEDSLIPVTAGSDDVTVDIAKLGSGDVPTKHIKDLSPHKWKQLFLM